jgi:hypothetical protein
MTGNAHAAQIGVSFGDTAGERSHFRKGLLTGDFAR